jgi:hypothetical protein
MQYLIERGEAVAALTSINNAIFVLHNALDCYFDLYEDPTGDSVSVPDWVIDINDGCCAALKELDDRILTWGF